MILIKQLRYIVFILCVLSFQALAALTITGDLTFTYTDRNGNSRNYEIERMERRAEIGRYDSWVNWVGDSALLDPDAPSTLEDPNGRQIQAVYVLNRPDAGLRWNRGFIVFFIQLDDSTWVAFSDQPLGENDENRPSINPPYRTPTPNPGLLWTFMAGLVDFISPVLLESPQPRIFTVRPVIISTPEITEDGNGRSISGNEKKYPIEDETKRDNP